MESREMTFVPGLVKLLDEVLVNAMDNHQRDQKGTSRIDVWIDPKASRVIVSNNGKPVPVRKHATENVYVPELIFGHLLTGSNFGGGGSGSGSDESRAAVGGRHGYGAKLANIFSRSFQVSIFDAERGLAYRQVWRANMHECGSPELTELESAAGRSPEEAAAAAAEAWGPDPQWPDEGCAAGLAAALARGESMVRVAFEVDAERFGAARGRAAAAGIDPGSAAQMRKRVCDAAGLLGGAGVRVSLDGRRLRLGGFKEYCLAYPPGAGRQELLREAGVSGEAALAYARCGPLWEVAAGVADAGAGRGGEAVSFVNGVSTSLGGAHAEVVLAELSRRVAELVTPRARAALAEAAAGAGGDAGAAAAGSGAGSATVTAAQVRPHLRVFVSCRVPEPSFDSQSKDRLTNPPTPEGLGSLPKITARFVKEVAAAGVEAAVLEAVVSKAQAQAARALRKAAGPGARSKMLSGAAARALHAVSVPKLEDASLAGTARAEECTLILTEGDSAKALAVAGLAEVGRELFGVLPLRGKLLNVRDVPLTTAVRNQEIESIIRAMGLDPTRQYASLADARARLRYGRVMVMADQDHDGSHIKGLVLNFLQTVWPSLVASTSAEEAAATEGAAFVEAFVTPVIKARRGSEVVDFFSVRAYERWRAEADRAGWRVKYYKGLGTSTAAEGRAYFSQLASHRVPLAWGGPGDADRLDLAFAKARADDRKEWLLAAPRETRSRAAIAEEEEPGGTGGEGGDAAAAPRAAGGGGAGQALPVGRFVDEELIEFSWADVHRSIPSVMDGLKPSQRKVLFTCLGSRAGAEEVKVAQLAGAVAQATAYHHGEASLVAAIVHMAQGFVGANNLPLLEGVGQFGTRLAGGRDAASARYIFTRLSGTARALFPAADDALLPRCEDDGLLVEPVSYAPVVPLVLVNGAGGIGTGWSTGVPMHSPRDVALVVREALRRAEEAGLAADAAGDARGPPSAAPGGEWNGPVAWSAAEALRWAPVCAEAVGALFPGQAGAVGHMTPWWRGFAGSAQMVPREDGEMAVETLGRLEALAMADYEARFLPARGKAGRKPPSKARRDPRTAAADGAAAAEESLAAAVSAGGPLAVRVTELPVGRWGDAFKRSLAGLAEKGLVHDIVEASTDELVDVTVVLSPAGVKRAAAEGLAKLLRLASREGLGNMHLFDPCGRITRYSSAAHVLSHFAPVRLRLYERRRSAEEARLAEEEAAAARRAAFIAAVVAGAVDIAGRPQAEVEQAARRAVTAATATEATASHVADLLQLPLRSLTSEAAARNEAQAREAAAALEAMRATSAADLWRADLDVLAAQVESMGGHARA